LAFYLAANLTWLFIWHIFENGVPALGILKRKINLGFTPQENKILKTENRQHF
jgi:hypothetical protein